MCRHVDHCTKVGSNSSLDTGVKLGIKLGYPKASVLGFPSGIKNLPGNAGDIDTRLGSLGQEDPPEEGMATHFSILAWRIPWTEGRGACQAMVHRVAESLTQMK